MGEDRKYKVLLLDDERVIRLAINAYLLGTEFTLTAVGTAEEALQALRRSNYDVVVSDIIMSPVDGFGFRSRMREFAPELPIIFMTSAENDGDNQLFVRIMDDLFSYYLPKRGEATLLLQKLRQVVKAFDLRQFFRLQQTIIDRNRSVAGMVQQSLLPPWAHRGDGYEFAYMYRPLDKVSGDLLDFFPVSEGAALMFFGDVSGHGTHAGLVMAALQTYLHQTVDTANAQRPHEIARLVNRFLCANFSGIVYICAMIVYWDFRHNLLRMLNCGMPDLVVMAYPGSPARRLKTDSHGSAIPLGMVSSLANFSSLAIESPVQSLLFFQKNGLAFQWQKRLGGHPPKLNHFLPQQPHQIPYRRTLWRNVPPFWQRIEFRGPLVVECLHGGHQ